MVHTIEELYNKYHKIIHAHICFRVNNNVAIADELSNDVFVKAYAALDRFDDTQSKITTWLYTIANNHVIDYYRKQKNEITRAMSDMHKEGEKEYDLTCDLLTPEQEMFNAELGEAIKSAVNKLPNSVKRIIRLRYFSQKSYDEISILLGIPIGTVKGTINRGRELLMKSLKKQYETI